MSDKTLPNIASYPSFSHDLLTDGKSWLATLQKAPLVDGREGSKQGGLIGRVQQLIDYDSVALLKDHNVHHSAALEAKARATVGLSHRSEKIAEKLNEFCVISWQDTLDAVTADYFEYANGFLEIVRNPAGKIRGVYHLPAKDVWVSLEANRNVFHYEIGQPGGFALTETLNGLHFARYGERDDFITRAKIQDDRKDFVSEVIHFPLNRGRRSPYYGYMDWAAATPSMELDHCVTQYMFDFFFNGGVPEAIYNILGRKLDPDDWEAIKAKFAEHVGIGNRRRILLLNLAGEDITVDFQKLTVDGQTTGDNQPMVDAQALKVLSAHRTPPILAGVTQPGKIGANNEITNAMMLFQLLAIGPAQKQISQIFASTLGDPKLNGDLGLTSDDFLGVGSGDPEDDPTRPPDQATGMPAQRPKDHKGNGFRSILDELDLGKTETVGKMRMSMAESQSRNRDLSQGVASRGEDVAAGRGDRS
jgi:hypothetical protein